MIVVISMIHSIGSEGDVMMVLVVSVIVDSNEGG